MGLDESPEKQERFSRLFKKHLVVSLRWAARYFPDLDPNDVAQEAWQAVWEGMHGLRSEAEFKQWFFVVLRNVGIDMCRRKKKRLESSLDEAVEAGFSFPDPEEPFDVVFCERETREQRTALAIRQLPPLRRQLVVLLIYEQLSYDEAAEVLGIPIGTVRSNYFRARQQLAPWLHPDE